MFGNMRSLKSWLISYHKILTRNWTEMLQYKREVVILLKMFLDFKSKHIIKDAIAQIERK